LTDQTLAEANEALQVAIKNYIAISGDVENPIVVDYVLGAAYIRPGDDVRGAWYFTHGSESHGHSLEGLASYVARDFRFDTGDEDGD
jgi:hypothetical protein